MNPAMLYRQVHFVVPESDWASQVEALTLQGEGEAT